MTSIVFVEDEAIVATDVAQRLKRRGYDVSVVAATGEAALRTVEKLHQISVANPEKLCSSL